MHIFRTDRCHNYISINGVRNKLLVCVVQCHMKYSYVFVVSNLITKRIVHVLPCNNDMTEEP